MKGSEIMPKIVAQYQHRGCEVTEYDDDSHDLRDLAGRFRAHIGANIPLITLPSKRTRKAAA